MRRDKQPLRIASRLETPTVYRIVRAALALAGLFVLLGLVAVLPGVDRLIDGLAVSPAALALAVGTFLIVAALLYVAPELERALEQVLDGPEGVVTDAAASAKLLAGFAAVVVAYRGFAPAATPAFEAFEIGGLYHLGFLLVGAAVLAAFTRRLYRCWGPASRLLTATLVDRTGRVDRTSTDQ